MRSSSQHLARIFRHASLAALLAAATLTAGGAVAAGRGEHPSHHHASAARAHHRARAAGGGHKHARHHGRGRAARRGSRGGHGHAARSLQASDVARLHEVSASGATLYEVGRATGTLPGGMEVRMKISARFTGTFTIHTGHGTIRGRGSATPHGHGTIESFAGTLRVTGGSGRYAHARGHAGLYGTFNRNDYALSIKTTGTLRY